MGDPSRKAKTEGRKAIEEDYDIDAKTALAKRMMTRRRALTTAAKVAVGAGVVIVAGAGVGAYLLSRPGTPSTTSTTTSPSLASSSSASATPGSSSSTLQTTTTSMGVSSSSTGPSSASASASSSASGPRPYGGTWKGTWGNLSDADDLNPLIDLTNQGGATFELVYSTLLIPDANFQPRPWAATGYDASTDLTTYTFHLVTNSTWHDGQPFTSADCKFTFDYAKQYNLGTWGVINSLVKSTAAPDPYTFTVTLNGPSASFPGQLTAYNAWIVPQHIWSKIDDPANFANDTTTMPVIGNGPFKLLKWVKGQYMQFQKNPTFWMQGIPYLDELIINAYNTQDDELLAFQSGTIDFAELDPTQVSSVQGNSNATVSKFQLQGNAYLHFNFGKGAPFTDQQFRIAVAHAMDKQSMVATAYAGYGVVDEHQMSFIFEAGGWTSPNITVYDYDPAMAKSILDAAGYKVGSDGWRTLTDGTAFSPTIIGTIFNGGSQALAQLQAANLQSVGINAKVAIQDATTWDNNYFAGDFDMASVPYYGTYNTDPETWLRDLFETGSSTNAGKYSNPQLDALFKQQAVEGDIAKRKAIFQQIDVLMSTDLPVVRMPYWVQPFVMDNNFKGWVSVLGLGPISDKGTAISLPFMYDVNATGSTVTASSTPSSSSPSSSSSSSAASSTSSGSSG